MPREDLTKRVWFLTQKLSELFIELSSPEDKETLASTSAASEKASTSSDWTISDPQKVWVTPRGGRQILDSASKVASGNFQIQPKAKSGAQVALMAPTPAATQAKAWEASWTAAADDAARILIENQGRESPNAEIARRANEKTISRLMTEMVSVRKEAAEAKEAAAAARVSERFKPALPPKFGNKEKDLEIRKWLPVVEEYLVGCPVEDYLNLAGSYLEGRPRSYFQSKFDAFKKENPGSPIPENPKVWFRDTLVKGYGLISEDQAYWDTWNKLRQGTDDIQAYNSAFEQAMTDLADQLTDEQVKIEKYKGGLQGDLRELARSDASGKRWGSLADVMEFATNQWAVVKARLDKSSGGNNKSGGSSSGTSGRKKRKGAPAGGSSELAPTKKFSKLSQAEKTRRFKEKLCLYCADPNHKQSECPKKGKKDFA
jgi:hypothetical protein